MTTRLAALTGLSASLDWLAALRSFVVPEWRIRPSPGFGRPNGGPWFGLSESWTAVRMAAAELRASEIKISQHVVEGRHEFGCKVKTVNRTFLCEGYVRCVLFVNWVLGGGLASCLLLLRRAVPRRVALGRGLAVVRLQQAAVLA